MFSEEGMKPDPEKIQEIRETPAAENKKSLSSFLGLTNYMKRFIHDCSAQTHHLRELLQEDKDYIQTETHEQALTILNNLLIVKIVFPIFATIKKHLFTQTLVLTAFQRSFYRNSETKKVVKLLRIIQGPSPLPKKIIHNLNVSV